MALQRRTVRWLFIGTVPLLLLQYILVGLIGLRWSEPWPALVMPSFQQVFDPARITTDVTTFEVIFEDGRREVIPPAELLADLPRSHHSAVLTKQFRPLSVGSTRVEAPAQQPPARTWLAQRLALLAPDRKAVRVDVVWHRLTVHPYEGASRVTQQPLDTLAIPLR